MTYREFLAALAAFVLLYILLVATVIAAPKWKREVGIHSWCNDLQIIQDIIKLERNGDGPAGDLLARKAFHERRCVRLPLPVAAFRPAAIAATFPSFEGAPVTVIKGHLIMNDETLGREVFVIVPSAGISDFQLAEEVVAPPQGPKYAGWQDV